MWKIISKGAEAEIYLGRYLGMPAVLKKRASKKYRNSILDKKLRITRTRREARLLHLVKVWVGLPTPFVFYVDLQDAILIMEYIPGKLLREVLRGLEIVGNIDKALSYLRRLGQMLATLHEAGIIHGDFTTSNVIVHENTNELFIIDFGLGLIKKTKDPEDYAIELRVFKKGLDIYHSEYSNKYFEEFLKGYREFAMADLVLERYNEIALRGRYIATRRLKKKFIPLEEYGI